MVIEKVFGIQATSLSLSERFTKIARRNAILRKRNQAIRNQVLKARRQAYNRRRLQQQRYANSSTGFRRYGSETNISNLTRSNSFGNLSQRSVHSNVRGNFRRNLGRSASYTHLSQLYRGLRGRTRGVMRGGRMQRLIQRPNQMRRVNRGGNIRGGNIRGNRGRGRGRGYANRPQLEQPLPSREELDQQLDQYMSATPAALDRDLEDYMKSAMELDETFTNSVE